MKRAAIITMVLAAIALVVFIYLGNQNTVSGSEQAQSATNTSIVEEPIPTISDEQSAILESDQVVAEGKLIPVRYVNLSFNRAGMVEDVYVEEGDPVEAGELIATLSNQEEFLASIAAAELELVNAQQELKALYDNAPLEAAEALYDIVTAPQDVADAQKTLDSLQSGVVNETDIEIARANVAFAQNELDRARAAYQPYANKPEGNLTRAALLGKLAEAEKQYEDAVRRLNALTGTPSEQTITEAEADLELAKARLTEARRRYEVLRDGPDPDRLALADARLNNAEAQINAAEAALRNLQLIAPFSGTIVNNNLKIGEYVAPGVPVVMVVDYSDWLLETTDLTELNIVRISEGSPSVITCDALPDVQFPGKVRKINAIGENRQGDITYTVLIAMNQFDDRLLWNMTCSVVVFPDISQNSE